MQSVAFWGLCHHSVVEGAAGLITAHLLNLYFEFYFSNSTVWLVCIKESIFLLDLSVLLGAQPKKCVSEHSVVFYHMNVTIEFIRNKP